MGTRLIIVLALVAWQSGVAHAKAFTVTNTNETGAGSLRQAITDANAATGSNTIDITAMGTINLTGPLPHPSNTLTITGPGADKLTIQRSAGTFPVLIIEGVVEISGVTIKDGSNTGVGGNGGGIVVVAGNSLVLRNSTVTGNTAAIGSAIYADGALTIQGCTISGNTGTGVTTTATIYASETTTVSDSTIADNAGTAIIFAPAVANKTLTIDRSTISGNTDKIGVGGLQLQGTATINAAAIIRNSTFSGNSGLAGGDFWTSSINVALSLTNVTAVGSSTPSLLFDHTSNVNVTMRNTLLAGTGMRCNGGSLPTSQGHNLTSDKSCSLAGVTDKTGIDPMLGPLAANGSTTKTHTPLAGSPAINTGDSTAVDVKDQRGLPRVQFGTVDIGAVEVAEPVISPLPATQEVATGKPLTLTIAATNQNSAMPLTFQWRKDGTAIAGATSDTYTKPNAAVEDSGMYDVLVTNEGGSVPSTAIAVTVSDDGGSGSGGCCSSTGQGAWSNAVLGLLMAVFLGVPRRSRAAQRRR